MLRDNSCSQKYCSHACGCAARSSRKIPPSDHYNRRRAQKLRTEVEPVDRLRVFERDKWICHLCGKKVNKRLKSPHRMSASIDHVIPLARGGGHTYRNVRLAHRGCNSSKGARGGGEQLALI